MYKKASKSAVLSATAALAATILAVVIGQAHAQVGDDEAEAAIKYRQSVMSVMGGVMGTTVGQLRDGFEYGPDLEAMAGALEASSHDIPALFPEGTDEGETHALPAVWEKPDDFKEAASNLEDKAVAFSDAVSNGDRAQTFKAFKAVGKACKSCHEDFREEQD